MLPCVSGLATALPPQPTTRAAAKKQLPHPMVDILRAMDTTTLGVAVAENAFRVYFTSDAGTVRRVKVSKIGAIEDVGILVGCRRQAAS